MNVLICSQAGEYQVEAVCKYLKKLGATPVLFERYRQGHYISYHYTRDQAYGILQIDAKKYKLTEENFPSVWYRPKPILLSEIPGEIPSIEEKFSINEWKIILQAFDIFLPKSKWINPLSKNIKASNKPYQLQLAHQVGLITPDTVITNNADETLKLFDKGKVVFKTLNCFFSTKKAIYTNQVEKKQIQISKEMISRAPGIFQQYCKKAFELRVTVVGDKFFVVKINSQNFKNSIIDWRRNPNKDLYEIGDLSKDSRTKLLELHKKLNLIYAAYDFIVDEEGNEIFLEGNPSGQWLWLEKVLNLDISLAVAEELISL